MRIEFQMSESDKAKLLEACKSGPTIALQCGPVMSPQERANIAWGELGKKMGFKAMTVQPTGKGDRFFSAEVECPGIEIEPGKFSGCNQSAGDCPRCGK